MSQQAIRQAARRAALDGLSRRRTERAEQEKRLKAMAVRALVAVRERHAAVAEHERHAGDALREMTDVEGLSLRDAAEWCGREFTVREVTRLRRLAVEHDGVANDTTEDHDGPAYDQMSAVEP